MSKIDNLSIVDVKEVDGIDDSSRLNNLGISIVAKIDSEIN